ncbi:MAG: protein phosphatase 2C domain-containing protein [Oscillospiraceae bacterium]|nr:protein phosphatase 2C domain-containing protein [Oscillospiraceae bacterium]
MSGEQIDIIKARVRGASHKLKGIECQDSFKISQMGEVTVLAVADGHGSDSCPHSRTGSEIAVNVFHSLMKKYCLVYSHDADSPKTLEAYFKREGNHAIAKAIENEWKSRVENNYRKRLGSGNLGDAKILPQIWKLHGTTLLGLVITPTFYFAFRLGDGDLLCINHDGVVSDLVIDEKILGVETHSLSRENAWEKSRTSTISTGEMDVGRNFAFMLSTDGFSNSYPTEEAFYRTCLDYYSAIKEHGAEIVQKNLRKWLEETSKDGSGDDITVLFAVV